ncbi:MAG: hypothetical protein IJ099_01210 [Alphaproteobacteria bacterium]|nr:hypothetical protein [Alphaproteobacteria bacterium]
MKQNVIQEQRQKQQIERAESRLQMINFIIIATFFCCGCFITALCLATFSVYSWNFYLSGKSSGDDAKADNSEVWSGIKAMLKSWMWLLAVLYLLWCCS